MIRFFVQKLINKISAAPEVEDNLDMDSSCQGAVLLFLISLTGSHRGLILLCYPHKPLTEMGQSRQCCLLPPTVQ